jgi:N-formylglutamate amidohydrolase
MTFPVLFHVPHASVEIPQEALGDFLISPEELSHQRLRLTDWFTDELFTTGFPPAQVVAAPVSRLVVDVERFCDDAIEPCARVGMGATYVKTVEGRPLRSLPPERRRFLLDTYYWPHHRRLDEAAAACLGNHGRCVIIDAHSFPVDPLPTQIDFSDPPEIGIGSEPGHTPAGLLNLAEEFFRSHGFVVGVDRPFRGALVPNAFYGKDRRVSSIMIEIRRDLYLEERSGNRNDGFPRMQELLTDFRSAVLDHVSNEAP